MLETYIFKYRRKKQIFWRRIRITGFGLDRDLDRMTVNLPGGAIVEIPSWSECYVSLGKDYHEMLHRKMQTQAGQAIPIRA